MFGETQDGMVQGIWGTRHWRKMDKKQTDKGINNPKSNHEENIAQIQNGGRSTHHLSGAPQNYQSPRESRKVAGTDTAKRGRMRHEDATGCDALDEIPEDIRRKLVKSE